MPLGFSCMHTSLFEVAGHIGSTPTGPLPASFLCSYVRSMVRTLGDVPGVASYAYAHQFARGLQDLQKRHPSDVPMCLQDVPKDQKTKHVPNANITLQVQWVPFDFTL